VLFPQKKSPPVRYLQKGLLFGLIEENLCPQNQTMKTTAWTVMICLGTAAILFTGCKTNSSNNKTLSTGKTPVIHGEPATKNQAAAEAFLATNKNNPGVITLPDGLQYRVITNGTGATPAPDDIVTIRYRGWLLDGTVFDNTFKLGHPVQVMVSNAIPGWTEALQKMKVGSRWQLFVPPQLAYGKRRPALPSDAVLIFEIDLLSTKRPPPTASDIIKVPSVEELKQGAQVEVIKKEDLEKMQKQQSP
jgi:FKBP-type peptidyl-prolyl cis-trans isomerase